ncbi:hypothetical protein ACIGG9_24855 [Pseudonocardia alni]|uniref:hypothetical protein n=1 Tax=Pseudonocardia alni TaxID=33907 RepID=UPI0033E852DF
MHIAAGGGGIGAALGGIWDAVSMFFRDGMSKVFDAPANAIRTMLGNLFPGDTLANRLPKDGANSVLDGVKNMLFGAADE